MLQGGRQHWLGKYQEPALAYAQQGYDQLQEYVKSNFNEYVEANNLTQACSKQMTDPASSDATSRRNCAMAFQRLMCQL